MKLKPVIVWRWIQPSQHDNVLTLNISQDMTVKIIGHHLQYLILWNINTVWQFDSQTPLISHICWLFALFVPAASFSVTCPPSLMFFNCPCCQSVRAKRLALLDGYLRYTPNHVIPEDLWRTCCCTTTISVIKLIETLLMFVLPSALHLGPSYALRGNLSTCKLRAETTVECVTFRWHCIR